MADQIALLEKALEAAPDNWSVRRSLAVQLKDAGRAADAGRLLQAAPEIPSAEKDRLFAAELIAEADRPAAHALLDKFLEENGASAQGHLLQGRLHKTDGDLAKAESHFKVAAVLDSSISVKDEMAGGAKAESPSGTATPVKEPEPETDAEAPELEPSAVPAPVPLTPRPLRPPGSETKEEAKKTGERTPAKELASEKPAPAVSAPVAVAIAAAHDLEEEAVAVAVAIDSEEEAIEHFDEATGERVFIVGEGEAGSCPCKRT